MSLSFFRRAFGMKKPDDREFEEFLKIYGPNNSIHLKPTKKSVRLVILTNNGSNVAFDTASLKENSKQPIVFDLGNKNINIADLAFGSFSLNNKKPLLYSTKIHDLRRNLYLNPNQNTWTRRAPILPQSNFLNETGNRSSVAICLLINLEWFNSCNSANFLKTMHQHSSSRRHFSNFFTSDNKTNAVSFLSPERNTKNVQKSSRNFYCMLFEHCTQLSVMVEALNNEIAIILNNSYRSNFGKPINFGPCSDLISAAFDKFLNLFKDFCSPKLSFPVWSTLNIARYLTSDLPLVRSDPSADNVAISDSLIHSSNGNSVSYDFLTDVFVRSCMNLIILKEKNKEYQQFISRLITGVLMYHTGWINTIATPFANTSSTNCDNNAQILTSTLLDQLLTQTGCVAHNLEALVGNIFSTTIITGQSRHYLLALLYFISYFLRFTCLIRSRECVPELGQADLFELEQQKKKSHVSGRSGRKSTSTTNTYGNYFEAHDSGISSQEDLSNMACSASTGSSPTHMSATVHCTTKRLTRDQCRIAEAAAHLAVSREVAAAAATGNILHQGGVSGGIGTSILIGPRSATSDISATHTTTGSSAPPDNSFGVSNSPRTSRAQYTDVPLLIEKYFDDDGDMEEDMCSCLSPTQPSLPITNHSQTMPGSSNSIPRTRSKCNTHESSSSSRLNEDNDVQIASSFFNDYSPCSNPVNFVNHCLISNTVLESYHTGFVLQATIENVIYFRSRLEDYLTDWLTYGPLVLRGANLFSKSTDSGEQSRPGKHTSRNGNIKHSRWSATGLIIDSDSRTVEALTLTNPNPNDLVMSEETKDFNQNSNWNSSRSGQPEHRNSVTLLTPAAAFKNSLTKRVTSIKAAPLVTQMIEQIHIVSENTNCSVLTLNHLESNFQQIYIKGLILKDLIIKESSAILQDPDRIMTIIGCAQDDLPLLLSIASNCSTQAANSLHNYYFD